MSWFLLLQRRWIIGPMGGYVRLDDTAMLAQMDMRGIKRKKRATLLDGLMIMENAALKILKADEKQQ